VQQKTVTTPGLPEISAAVTDVYLVDSAAIVPSGSGGSFFQAAIQCHNNHDDGGAARNFQTALDAGLDNLRRGYAYAHLGGQQLKKNNIAGAVSHFMKVFELKEILFESAHDAAQYMAVIYSELDRAEETARLEQLAAQTRARLGYSLAHNVAENIRQTVRSQKNKLLGKTQTKKTFKANIKEGLRPLGNHLRLTHTDDKSAHDAYLMLFNQQENMERYYQAFTTYAAKTPPPFVMEVMTAYAPKTLYDEHYAVIFPHNITDQREAYGLWLRDATMTCNDQVLSDNHTSSRYNAIKTNVEKVYDWEILLPANFDPETPENAALLTDPADGGYAAI